MGVRFGRVLVACALVACVGCGSSRSGDDDDDSIAEGDAGADAATDAGPDAGDKDAGPVPCEDVPEGLQDDIVARDTETDCWTFTSLEEEDEVDRGSVMYPSLAMAPDGSLHAAYYKSRSVHDRVDLRYLTNASGAWQTENADCGDALRSFLGGGVMAVDGAGTVHMLAAVLDPSGALVHRTLAQGVWSAESLDGVDGAPSIDIAVDPEGEAHLLVGGQDGPLVSSGDLVQLEMAQGEWVAQPIPAGPFAGRYADLAIARSGTAHVLAENGCPGGPEVLEECSREVFPAHRDLELFSNEQGTWGSEVIASDLFGNASVGVAVAADDTVHVVYVNESVAIVHGVRRAGLWSWDTVDDQQPWMFASLAMAVDGAGDVHLAVTKGRGLHYFTNTSGTWTTEVVDELSSSLGSVFVGRDGVLHLAYVDATEDGRDSAMVIAVRTCP